MSIIKYIDRLKHIDALIRQERTGSPDEFAKKLRISKRRMYQIMSEIEEMGAPVYYNRLKCTYMYKFPTELKIEFEKISKN